MMLITDIFMFLVKYCRLKICQIICIPMLTYTQSDNIKKTTTSVKILNCDLIIFNVYTCSACFVL